MNVDRTALFTAVVLLFLMAPAPAHADSLKGRPAPPFDLPALSGEGTLSLADLRGKIVVLHFGTGW